MLELEGNQLHYNGMERYRDLSVAMRIFKNPIQKERRDKQKETGKVDIEN